MRLAHQLSLTLLATALAAAAAMGGLMAWNLRAGFSDYLRAQDRQRLQSFAGAARAAIDQWGIEGLRAQPQRLLPPGGDLLEGPPGPPPGPDGRPPDRPRPPPGGERDPARRGLSLVDPQGHLIWGRSPPPGRQPLEEPIVLEGRTVALARLMPRPEAPEALDRRFLQRQFLGMLAIGAVVAALAAALAWGLARRWLQPLTAVQKASHRLAQGDFSVRLPRRAAALRNEFDALVDDVNHLAAALQSLESSRRRWMAELSHELRTPLTVLRGELEAVRDGVRPFNDERLEALSREVGRLRRLADDFHCLALADLGALPFHPHTLEVGDLVQGVVARHQALAAQAGLTLALHPLPPLPPVRWDGVRIEQVMDNLLTNAVAYTDAPGLLEVTVEAVGEGVQIQVDDSPPGVSPGLLPKLFDPLFRADPARQRRDGAGSGLGLSIAQAWVQRHGGRLQASTSPRGGLRVTLSLPSSPPP
ncbi:ATP-binding protein [Inhella gelatinilytica]|uniref:histidine kinase n=1 Tax=Inhella gelatinilytica TaxID=2795030 RepID=A0A931IWS1_9BURK|nr:ATP-binding protein [Inhella gelatinilytica]MBH9553584.1 HAMP domain-containing protein [Inhella gelatinilytica]